MINNSNIYITNYPQVSGHGEFINTRNENDRIEILYGYDYNINNKEVTLQIARDLITAIYTYDQIYIEGNNILDIIQVIGSENLKELLRLHIIKIIPDQKMNPVLMKKEGEWIPDFFPYAQGGIKENQLENIPPKPIHKWSHIEYWFDRRNFNSLATNAILYMIDENCVDLGNEKEIIKTINNETNKDIYSPLFLEDKSFYRIGEKGHLEYNTQNRIRLQQLNKTAVIAAKLNIDNIKTDAAINELLIKKTSSAFSKDFHFGLDALIRTEQKKGFPDLGQLFIDEVIDLNDILKLRENFQNKIFRYWLQTTKYDEQSIQQEIMNSVKNVIGSKISNPLRLLGTSLIGIGGFIPGLAASTFDSYILDKILKGWHPNFFLDDVLKQKIDECIEIENKRKLKAKAMETFKGVGRNDPCPCGSGKKFKKCHGRILM